MTPCIKVTSPLRSLLPSPVGDLNSDFPLYNNLLLQLLQESCKKDTEKDSRTYTVYSMIWGKNLRQSSDGRTVLVHARQGGAREVHQTVVRCAAGTSEPFAVEIGSTKDPLSVIYCLPS